MCIELSSVVKIRLTQASSAIAGVFINSCFVCFGLVQLCRVVAIRVWTEGHVKMTKTTTNSFVIVFTDGVAIDVNKVIAQLWSNNSTTQHILFYFQLPIWGFRESCEMVHCITPQTVNEFLFALCLYFFAYLQPFGWNLCGGFSNPRGLAVRESWDSGMLHPTAHPWVPISSQLHCHKWPIGLSYRFKVI